AAAAQIQDPERRRRFIAAQGEDDKKGSPNFSKLDRQADDALATSGESENVRGAKAPGEIGAPSYKKGGFVKKTGLARLHKGEFVAPRKYARAAAHFVGKKRKGNSRKLVSKKIGVLRHEGVPQKQAVAMAINMGKAGRITKSGGYRRVGRG